jgi:hypothetical protein
MNTSSRSVCARGKSSVPQVWVLIGMLATRGAGGAATLDFKTLKPEEAYTAEGVSVVLTQKTGEATVKLRTAAAPKQVAETLTANAAKFALDRALPDGNGMYRLQATDP